MTQEKDYLDLADRVEAAKGPDRELDCLIWAAATEQQVVWTGADNHLLIIGSAAIGWIDPGEHSRNFGCNRLATGPGSIPAYTASIDAAVTVVPEGWTWSIPGFVKPWWDCRIVRLADGRVSQPLPQPCETPPLAILAAALRAHASRVGDRRGGE
jgi:hypothetical protein